MSTYSLSIKKDYSIASTENTYKILNWILSVSSAATPTPEELTSEELKEDLYEKVLLSKAFTKRVKRVEKLLLKNSSKLIGWNK